MLNLLVYSFLVASLSAFIVIILHKTRIIDGLSKSTNSYLYKLSQCNFCLSFWVSLVISCLVVVYTGNILYMAIPVISSPISRIML